MHIRLRQRIFIIAASLFFLLLLDWYLTKQSNLDSVVANAIIRDLGGSYPGEKSFGDVNVYPTKKEQASREIISKNNLSRDSFGEVDVNYPTKNTKIDLPNEVQDEISKGNLRKIENHLANKSSNVSNETTLRYQPFQDVKEYHERKQLPQRSSQKKLHKRYLKNGTKNKVQQKYDGNIKNKTKENVIKYQAENKSLAHSGSNEEANLAKGASHTDGGIVIIGGMVLKSVGKQHVVIDDASWKLVPGGDPSDSTTSDVGKEKHNIIVPMQRSPSGNSELMKKPKAPHEPSSLVGLDYEKMRPKGNLTLHRTSSNYTVGKIKPAASKTKKLVPDKPISSTKAEHSNTWLGQGGYFGDDETVEYPTKAPRVTLKQEEHDVGVDGVVEALSGVNVVSMSLYGSIRRYTVGAIRNADMLQQNFPGWRLRVYTEAPSAQPSHGVVPEEVIESLRQRGVEIFFVSPRDERVPPMGWRFLVADDMNVDRFIIRDADSRLTERDAAAVAAWVQSGRPFNCIRDHPSHARFAISGGLWGGRPAALRSVMRRSWRDLMTHMRGNYLDDMNFLNTVIWPLVSPVAYCSDSVSCDVWPNAHPFPVPRYGYETVGQVMDERERGRQHDIQILRRTGENPKCSPELAKHNAMR